MSELDDLSIEELRARLDRRGLRDDHAEIVRTLRAKQKVIYGVDDRVDVFRVTDAALLADADSVVALFRSADITDNSDGTSALATENFGESMNLCGGEPFRDQPTGAFCSGFLVAPDVIATAGHCVNAGDVTQIRFVFGFRMRDAATAATTIDNAQIYRGTELLGRELDNDGPDWALVRIDREVTDHPVVRVRRSGRIPDGEPVHVIGHPSGLPTKVADGAAVRDNSPSAFFVANLDTYGGNSGSPVFNTTTHEVEGILVRGENDFVSQGACKISLICPTTTCRGEDCTRTTQFTHLLPDD
ncbi:serine protease [Spirillospora sp. NPDC047279]|uniref:trypsin-like serine peptidase n=1 Tax=Spirillospora sp. NPDC047279 TaxID=3155478 RepID=UPI0033E69FAC